MSRCKSVVRAPGFAPFAGRKRKFQVRLCKDIQRRAKRKKIPNKQDLKGFAVSGKDRKRYDKSIIYLPRQYLPQSHV